ncbi:MAG: DMT family transporter [Gammaproteobacteria bacterium]|nr:DMT family transporter [Gammaproteobacteria bacterium]
MFERRTHLDPFGAGVLLVLCTLWGIQQVAIKLALAGISPIMQGGLRSVIAVALLIVWMRLRRIPMSGADGAWRPGAVAGAMFALEFALIYWGLSFTSASRMIVFVYLAPFVVAAGIHVLVPEERLRGWQLLGTVLAFAGVLFVFRDRGGDALPANAWIGDLMGIGAAIFWGLTTLVVRATRLGRAEPSRALFYQLLLSAILLPLWSLMLGEPGVFDLTPVVLGSLAFQGVIVAFASYMAWFWLLVHYPVPQLSSFTFIAPLVGVAGGVVILDEPFSAGLLAGGALVAGGIYLVNRRA